MIQAHPGLWYAFSVLLQVSTILCPVLTRNIFRARVFELVVVHSAYGVIKEESCKNALGFRISDVSSRSRICRAFRSESLIPRPSLGECAHIYGHLPVNRDSRSCKTICIHVFQLYVSCAFKQSMSAYVKRVFNRRDDLTCSKMSMKRENNHTGLQHKWMLQVVGEPGGLVA